MNDVRRKIIDAYQGQVIISDQMDVQEGRLIARAEIEPGTFQGHHFVFGDFGYLPAPEAFSVNRIVFCFSASCLAQDVQAMIESVPWKFNIGYKSFASGLILFLSCSWEQFNNPMRVCEFCDGVYVVTQDPKCPSCGANKFRRLVEDEKRGNPEGWSYVHDNGRIPQVLANQIGFNVQLEKPRTEIVVQRRMIVWCCLEGLHARGVI